MNRLSLIIPLVVCAGFVATAHAQPQRDVTDDFAFKFAYDPAHLQDAGKAEKVLVRLERAVRRHCEAGVPRTIQDRALVRQCVDKTMVESMDKFGSSLLTQAYEARAAG